MASIIHFDISADNQIRAKEFYEKLFEWKFRLLPGPANYYLIETEDLDGKTGIGGGMAKRESSQQPGVTNFMGVASIDDSARKVKELGGVIIQPKQVLPGWGFLVLCTDTENNLFGLFQEDKNAK
jgi:predicted enzyme related to lactoylglutathione lyase